MKAHAVLARLLELRRRGEQLLAGLHQRLVAQASAILQLEIEPGG